jgi:ribosomal protein S18 acetylase RimI-like enzyme
MNSAELVVRQAVAEEVPALLRVERELTAVETRGGIQNEPAETSGLPKLVAAGECYVGTLDGALAGYAVMHDRFFHAGFVEILNVGPSFRRRGVGRSLLRHLVECCHSPKIWTSTNLSNTPMQTLLAREGFLMSGFIEGLDEGDPELVYSKATSAAP